MRNIDDIKFDANFSKYGTLVPIENLKNIPFSIKRIYYIYGVDSDKRRGFHSHKNLHQVLICVHGHVKILVKTPFEETIKHLDSPLNGLYIGPMIWREMFDFSDDAVLLVLASDFYTESDYIRDYKEYEDTARKYFKEN